MKFYWFHTILPAVTEVVELCSKEIANKLRIIDKVLLFLPIRDDLLDIQKGFFLKGLNVINWHLAFDRFMSSCFGAIGARSPSRAHWFHWNLAA